MNPGDPVITYIECSVKEYEELEQLVRKIAKNSMGPDWSFVDIQPVSISIGAALLGKPLTRQSVAKVT